MCGIAGIVEFTDRPLAPRTLEAMTKALAHRGPDDFGFAIFDRARPACTWRNGDAASIHGSVGLGNRRLKILDLSPAGHQPMSNREGTVWVTFNGEIYNYVELRQELVNREYDFRSHTDTEVILNAYVEWGAECFRRFNGMWGLAIYDTRDGSLILSRDRLGVKPLFVSRSADRIVFGSEIKALFQHPLVPRRANYRTIFNYAARHYRWVDGGRDSFFDGIENLPPAHYWRIQGDGTVLERRYWGLDPNRVETGTTDSEVVPRFVELFTDAVRLRLRSDVPVACMLSGGLDSSSVTCMAAKLSGTPVTTFSARYDEREFDEGPFIEATVRDVGSDARYVYPKAGDLLDMLQAMLGFHDEPICTVTWYAHWMVMKEVAGLGFPVLLNGHAGDELFAGYWDHYQYHFADLEAADAMRFDHEFDCWLRNHQRDPEEYLRLKARLSKLKSGEITEADSFTLYADVVSDDLRREYSSAPERSDLFANRGFLASRLYKELTYETVPATLRPEDRNSMAFSIETRSPFLDYRLAEFAFGLPNSFKIRDGLGKWVIREGMRGTLPECVRSRRDKQGMNAPTTHWFRSENRGAVRDILGSASLAARGVLNREEVLRCFEEHVVGRANHYMAIWQWLNLELWMRRFFDSPLASEGLNEKVALPLSATIKS